MEFMVEGFGWDQPLKKLYFSFETPDFREFKHLQAFIHYFPRRNLVDDIEWLEHLISAMI